MIYRFLLSADNLDLSKAELDALFNAKSKLEGKLVSLDLKIPLAEIIELCERSATVKRVYLGDKKIWQVTKGRFKEREPKARPGFHHTSLRPKLARLLINLSGVKKCDTILDSFCGSASILIEAGIMGIKSIGLDKDLNALKLAKKNIEQFNIRGCTFKEGDATDLTSHVKRVNAIVTDPPYGRSSKVLFYNMNKLYEKFFESAKKVTDKIIVMLPSSVKVEGFKVEGKYDIYVHKSLTRRIWVLKCK